MNTVVIKEKYKFVFLREYSLESDLCDKLEISNRKGLRLKYSDGKSIYDYNLSVQDPSFGNIPINSKTRFLAIFPMLITINIKDEISITEPIHREDKKIYRVRLNNDEQGEITQVCEGFINTTTHYTLKFESKNSYDKERFLFALVYLINRLTNT